MPGSNVLAELSAIDRLTSRLASELSAALRRAAAAPGCPMPMGPIP